MDRFSEVLYGLIIALSVTGSLAVGTGGARSVRLLLVGVVGASVSWGIVDAVMFVLGNVLRRARVRAKERAIRAAPDADHGRRLLAEALPAEVSAALTVSELDAIRGKIAALDAPERSPFDFEDLLGAGAVFLMVVLANVPVALPFVLMKDAELAVRVSHGAAIVLLFLGGCALGRYAELGSIRTGLATMSVGVVLIGLTIALGG